MKECKYCGTSYADNIGTCPNCGGSVVITAEDRQKVVEQAQHEKNAYVDSNKRLKLLVFGGIGVIAVVILLVVFAVVSSLNRTYTYTDDTGITHEMKRKEIQDYIELGETYLGRKEYVKAIEQFSKVPEEYGAYGKIRLKISEAVDGYNDEVLLKAASLLDTGKYTEAIAMLDSAMLFGERNNRFILKKEEIFRAYKEDFLTRATHQLEASQYIEALDVLSMAKSIFGNDDNDLVAKEEEILDEYKTVFLSQTSAQLEQNQYVEALSTLSAAQGIWGASDDVLSMKKKEVLSAYKADFFKRVDEYLVAKQYTEALASLATAKGIFGNNDAEIREKTIAVNKAKVLDKIAEYETAANYAAAIPYIERELGGVNNDAEIVTKLNSYKATYKEQIIENARSAFSESGYAAAIAILNQGISILGNDTDIVQAKIDYNAYAPISPWSLDYFTINEGEVKFLPELKDNYGNIQTNVFTSDEFSFERDAFLNGEYKRLTGTLFRTYEGRKTEGSNVFNNDGYPKIEIYCDDVLVYAEHINTGDEPKAFDLDISNVKVLRFFIYGFSHIYFECDINGGISELSLYKNVI